jgi:hypothetical protein
MPDYIDTRGVITDISFSEGLGVVHILGEEFLNNHILLSKNENKSLIISKQKKSLKILKSILDNHYDVLDNNDIFSFPSIALADKLESKTDTYLDPNQNSDAIYIVYRMAKNILSIYLEKKPNQYDYSFTCLNLTKDLLIKHKDKLNDEIILDIKPSVDNKF